MNSNDFFFFSLLFLSVKMNGVDLQIAPLSLGLSALFIAFYMRKRSSSSSSSSPYREAPTLFTAEKTSRGSIYSTALYAYIIVFTF